MPKSGNTGPVTPGQKAPTSGQYKPVGPRGGDRGPFEVTITEGNRVPPTKQPGDKYTLVDPTKHKPK